MNLKINNKINKTISSAFIILFAVVLAMAITAPVFGESYAQEYAHEVLSDTGLKIEKIVSPEPVPSVYSGEIVMIEAVVNPCGNIEKLAFEGNEFIAQRMAKSVKEWQFESRDHSYRVRIPIVIQ